MNRPPLAHPPARTALAPDFDAPHFRQALGRFATGVTVITTRVPGTDPARTDSAAFVPHADYAAALSDSAALPPAPLQLP